MTEQHPMTLSPELIDHLRLYAPPISQGIDKHETQLISAAYTMGADQELEACCDWLRNNGLYESLIGRLRAARRTKPPNLKKQALEALDSASYQPGSDFKQIDPARSATIRRALESLPDPQD